MSTCAHTTAMLDGLLSQDDAARALGRLGVDIASVAEGFEPDYRRMLFALDLLFVNGYGTSALAGFLETPHPGLDWRSPAEIVGEPDGIERVREVIGDVVVARRRRQPAIA